MQLYPLAVVNVICSDEFWSCEKYSKLFTGLDTIPGMKADVWLVNLYKLRAIAAGLKQEDGKKLNRMLEDSVIEPVEKVTDWRSGLTAAPKSDGKVRMCVELPDRKNVLNKRFITSPELVIRYPNCLESNFDSISGIEQVNLNQYCRFLMTVVTPWNRF